MQIIYDNARLFAATGGVTSAVFTYSKNTKPYVRVY